MQARVSESDRQPEPRAADRAGARRVGPPEAVEDPIHVFGAHAEPEVPNSQRDGVLIAVDGDHDGSPLSVFDGVSEEVPHDPAHPPRVHVDRGISSRCDQPHIGPVLVGELLHRGDHVFGEVRQARRLEFELHRSGVVAADLQQVGQQGLEALHLRIQQLGCPRGDGIELVALVVDHVGGEADRRQRRAQFVRDVGDEALLHERQIGELLDLRLDAVGHGVEGPPERRQLVFPVHVEPHVQFAGRELGTGVGRLGDRRGDRAQHEPGDPPDHHEQEHADDPERRLHEQQGLGCGGEVVGEVELVVADVGHLELLPDDDARNLALGAGEARVLPPLQVGVGLHAVAQGRGDDVLVDEDARGEILRGDRGRRADAEHRERVALGLLREVALHASHEGRQLRGASLRLGRVEGALHLRRRAPGVFEHLLLTGLQEIGLDGQGHPHARDDDRERRQREGQHDRAEAQRTAPQHRDAVGPGPPVDDGDAARRRSRARRGHAAYSRAPAR